MAIRLTILENDEQIELCFPESLNLLEALCSNQLFSESNCDGQGRCGRCRVKFHSSLAPVSLCEIKHLNKEEIGQNVRLACQQHLTQDTAISIMGHRDQSRSLNQILELPPLVVQNKSSCTGFGIAIDFGTSQIRLSLWDLDKGIRLSARHFPNPQIRFGSDVLTRLGSASESKMVAHQMNHLCASQISSVIANICECFAINPYSIKSAKVVANSAILTLLSCIEKDKICLPHFWNYGVQSPRYSSDEIRSLWKLQGAEVELLPSFAGFVGSDLLAAIQYTQLMKNRSSLLIDFGTNTEIALWDGQQLWLASAAGGPAFDSCGIKCGINACPGAIASVHLDENLQVSFDTVGNRPPIGISGTGMVDLCAQLISNKIVRVNGLFSKGYEFKRFNLDDEGLVYIDQADLGLLQQAIAAIKAGILCLCQHSQICFDQFEELWICGEFGSNLSIDHARSVGLIPDLPDERIHICAQAALLGCEEILLDPEDQKRHEILCKAKVINLSSDPLFDDFFLKSLLIKPLNSEALCISIP